MVPSALLGTLIGMYVVGFSINRRLLAMVLAIGIVVDDAIVVVEAVDRNHARGAPAAKGGDAQGDAGGSTGAIVAITSVLAAVFIPSALQTAAPK